MNKITETLIDDIRQISIRKRYMIIISFFFLGAIVSSLFELPRLLMSEAKNIELNGIFISSVFGALSGSIIAILYIKLKTSYIERINIIRQSGRELQEMNETLEDLVEERTNKLIGKNQELKRSEEALKELNATKDKFFSIIAHDLKNPLGSFKQATEVLLHDFDGLSDEDKKEFLSLMEESSKQLVNLLDNLLTWSRSQRGVIKYEPSDNDLCSILMNTISLLKFQADGKNIDLTCLNTTEPHYAYFDLNMVSTVIRNLTTNAIKFTPEGGNIIIGCSENGSYLKVYVKDNGIGMSDEEKNKLFKLKSTFSTEGTSNEKGTGLGLILCKEFIEKNKGSIWVESKKGEGTIFYFTLPLNKNV